MIDFVSVAIICIVFISVVIYLGRLILNKMSFLEGNGVVNIIKEEMEQNRIDYGKISKEVNEVIKGPLAIYNDSQEKRYINLESHIENNFKVLRSSQGEKITALEKHQGEKIDKMEKTVNELKEANKKENNALIDKIEIKFNSIQESNEKNLEEIRRTVNEKLHDTLEKSIGEKFRDIRDQLDRMHKAAGEIMSVGEDTRDLKRIFTGSKSRGMWGEVQLSVILEDILTPDQYSKDVRVIPNCREMVEFAVKFPGKGEKDYVWLPIDAKFPKEDYERLINAFENGDVAGENEAKKGLVKTIKKCAKEINDKYIDARFTTNFAIMFLPTEGLYAEVLRVAGLHQLLQKEYNVIISGPTTISAILNSFRIGFNTLSIEKRSSEILNIMEKTRTDFSKFGDILIKANKQLDTLSNTLESASKSHKKIDNIMDKALTDVSTSDDSIDFLQE